MVGGDIDAFASRLLGAERRHPVERQDGEGVRCVRQQTPHLHPATLQAFVSRTVADVVSAGETGSPG